MAIYDESMRLVAGAGDQRPGFSAAFAGCQPASPRSLYFGEIRSCDGLKTPRTLCRVLTPGLENPASMNSFPPNSLIVHPFFGLKQTVEIRMLLKLPGCKTTSEMDCVVSISSRGMPQSHFP